MPVGRPARDESRPGFPDKPSTIPLTILCRLDLQCRYARKARPYVLWNGTPEWIRTTDLLLRRLKSFLVFSRTCMRFVDAIWTESRISYLTAALLIATTLFCAGFRFAAVMIFSDSRSSTSDTCWLGTCV